MSRVDNVVERLGTEIVNCKRKCDGVRCDQSSGYYPRNFFLDPGDSFEVEACVVGRNPGSSSGLERELYKCLAERREDANATYKDCVRVWNSLIEIEYFRRPRHLLKELGLATDRTGFLWTEVVFCESETQRIPAETLLNCRQFLERILFDEKLVPEGRPILCLGNDAFENVRELVGKRNRWKVIRVYHPTGSRAFANCFAKQRKKRLTDRPLKGHLKDRFRRLVGEAQTYVCALEPSRVRAL